MARSDGFAVMDVSTSICDDPKFRLLLRQSPEHVASAFTAYVAVMAESWRSGRRVTIDLAWPAFLPYDPEAAAALTAAGLLDRSGAIPAKAWKSWFGPAQERREKARDRWTRYNAQRNVATALEPRGSDADTATSVPLRPSVPSEPSVSSGPSSARGRGKTNDDGLTTPPTKEARLLALSEEFKAGKLTELEYERQRREIA